MKVTIFEGTPEEFEKVHALLEKGGATTLSGASSTTATTSTTTDGGDDAGLNRRHVDFLRTMMSRRTTMWGQKDLFARLYAAGDAGLCRAELAEAMERSYKGFAGVIGALGRRTHNTPDYEAISAALGLEGVELVLKIEADGDDWRYTLRPEARKALEELGRV